MKVKKQPMQNSLQLQGDCLADILYKCLTQCLPLNCTLKQTSKLTSSTATIFPWSILIIFNGKSSKPLCRLRSFFYIFFIYIFTYFFKTHPCQLYKGNINVFEALQFLKSWKLTDDFRWFYLPFPGPGIKGLELELTSLSAYLMIKHCYGSFPSFQTVHIINKTTFWSCIGSVQT